MKSILIYAYLIGSLFLSLPTWATKIIIRGNPVFLHALDGVYFIPNSFKTSSQSNFVALDGVKYVCYLTPQPYLSILDHKEIKVNINFVEAAWVCYKFNKVYFAVIP
jgi:hypothetical protein